MTAKVTKSPFNDSVRIEISEFLSFYCELKDRRFGRIIEKERGSSEKEPLSEKEFVSALRSIKFVYPNKDEAKIKPLLPSSIFRLRN